MSNTCFLRVEYSCPSLWRLAIGFLPKSSTQDTVAPHTKRYLLRASPRPWLAPVALIIFPANGWDRPRTVEMLVSLPRCWTDCVSNKRYTLSSIAWQSTASYSSQPRDSPGALHSFPIQLQVRKCVFLTASLHEYKTLRVDYKCSSGVGNSHCTCCEPLIPYLHSTYLIQAQRLHSSNLHRFCNLVLRFQRAICDAMHDCRLHDCLLTPHLSLGRSSLETRHQLHECRKYWIHLHWSLAGYALFNTDLISMHFEAQVPNQAILNRLASSHGASCQVPWKITK